jgi:hypothetical protein
MNYITGTEAESLRPVSLEPGATLGRLDHRSMQPAPLLTIDIPTHRTAFDSHSNFQCKVFDRFGARPPSNYITIIARGFELVAGCSGQGSRRAGF